jgi:hypothetical protein
MLTFDVEGPPHREDFFDKYSLKCLHVVLDLLERNEFEGLFFITTPAAQRIKKLPRLVELLGHHEVGYHSSSHSVKPRIFEYTDTASYEDAVKVSFERETSNINPESGQTEGHGGILLLRETFPDKKIVCFRAPFLAWSPPHLEALRKLGIVFDFSADVSNLPLTYRGVVFYPSPVSIDGIEATFVHRNREDVFPRFLSNILLQRQVTVLMMHPSKFVQDPSLERKRSIIADAISARIAPPFLKFLLARLRLLEEADLINVTSSLDREWPPLDPRDVNVERVYCASLRAPARLFNARPRFIRSHFLRFFEPDLQFAFKD